MVLFSIEVIMALFVHDKIVRPYIGDVLVVILWYCFCRTFINGSTFKIALAVLLFAYLVEALQYFQLINHLGIQYSALARTILGHSFEWMDMLAYTAGIGIVLLVETYFEPLPKKQVRSTLWIAWII